jgi:Domain of unknown function (DUF4129)
MRSRSALEWAGTGLGAAAHGVWCGVLAAVLVGAAWPPLTAFSAAAMLTAAAVARWTARDDERVRKGRVLLGGLVLAAAAVLVAAGRSWAHDYIVWQVVRDVVFVAGVMVLGISLGRERQEPEEAVRLAIRAFALLCVVLAGAAAAGASLQWPAAAVAAVLVAGGLHVALVRYRSLTDLVAYGDRLRAWPWLLAVTGAILGVLAVAALAGQILDAGGAHALLASAVAALSFVARVLAYAVGWAGAGLLRAFAWLAGLAHVHVPRPEVPALRLGAGKTPIARQPAPHHSDISRIIATAVAAGVAVAVSIAVVALALRRLRLASPGAARYSEDRESVRTLRSGAADALAGLGRRLRMLAVHGRSRAHSPAELIRIRYEQLEARLSKAGAPRAAGTTVRDYLASCAAAAGGASGLPAPAADLAGVYELARYSASTVDEQQARRFEELARTFAAPPATRS